MKSNSSALALDIHHAEPSISPFAMRCQFLLRSDCLGKDFRNSSVGTSIIQEDMAIVRSKPDPANKNMSVNLVQFSRPH